MLQRVVGNRFSFVAASVIGNRADYLIYINHEQVRNDGWPAFGPPVSHGYERVILLFPDG